MILGRVRLSSLRCPAPPVSTPPIVRLPGVADPAASVMLPRLLRGQSLSANASKRTAPRGCHSMPRVVMRVLYWELG